MTLHLLYNLTRKSRSVAAAAVLAAVPLESRRHRYPRRLLAPAVAAAAAVAAGAVG